MKLTPEEISEIHELIEVIDNVSPISDHETPIDLGIVDAYYNARDTLIKIAPHLRSISVD